MNDNDKLDFDNLLEQDFLINISSDELVPSSNAAQILNQCESDQTISLLNFQLNKDEKFLIDEEINFDEPFFNCKAESDTASFHSAKTTPESENEVSVIDRFCVDSPNTSPHRFSPLFASKESNNVDISDIIDSLPRLNLQVDGKNCVKKEAKEKDDKSLVRPHSEVMNHVSLTPVKSSRAEVETKEKSSVGNSKLSSGVKGFFKSPIDTIKLNKTPKSSATKIKEHHTTEKIKEEKTPKASLFSKLRSPSMNKSIFGSSKKKLEFESSIAANIEATSSNSFVTRQIEKQIATNIPPPANSNFDKIEKETSKSAHQPITGKKEAVNETSSGLQRSATIVRSKIPIPRSGIPKPVQNTETNTQKFGLRRTNTVAVSRLQRPNLTQKRQ